MAKDKKPDHVSELDGYKVEWRRRRSCLDADVHNADGELVIELEYPKIGGGAPVVMDEFAREAVAIAKREEADKPRRDAAEAAAEAEAQRKGLELEKEIKADEAKGE